MPGRDRFELRIGSDVRVLDREQALLALLEAQVQGLDVQVTAVLARGPDGSAPRAAQRQSGSQGRPSSARPKPARRAEAVSRVAGAGKAARETSS